MKINLKWSNRFSVSAILLGMTGMEIVLGGPGWLKVVMGIFWISMMVSLMNQYAPEPYRLEPLIPDGTLNVDDGDEVEIKRSRWRVWLANKIAGQ